MLRALGEFRIGGVKTLLGFHRALLEHPCFRAGETCDGVVESPELAARAEELTVDEAPAAVPGAGSLELATVAEVDGRRVDVRLLVAEPPYRELARRRRRRTAASGAGETGAVVSPMQGTVLDVKVADGDPVEAGDVICIVEAMKMENEVLAHWAGIVRELAVSPGTPVTAGQAICVLEANTT
jgi:acetyl-CoA/propionyl-CoA carboxylase biotin carboxyl carrier protein